MQGISEFASDLHLIPYTYIRYTAAESVPRGCEDKFKEDVIGSGDLVAVSAVGEDFPNSDAFSSKNSKFTL